MTDTDKDVQAALDKAAEFEMLGSLAADQEKRAEYRARAKFQCSTAEELKSQLSTSTPRSSRSRRWQSSSLSKS